MISVVESDCCFQGRVVLSQGGGAGGAVMRYDF